MPALRVENKFAWGITNGHAKVIEGCTFINSFINQRLEQLPSDEMKTSQISKVVLDRMNWNEDRHRVKIIWFAFWAYQDPKRKY